MEPPLPRTARPPAGPGTAPRGAAGPASRPPRRSGSGTASGGGSRCRCRRGSAGPRPRPAPARRRRAAGGGGERRRCGAAAARGMVPAAGTVSAGRGAGGSVRPSLPAAALREHRGGGGWREGVAPPPAPTGKTRGEARGARTSGQVPTGRLPRLSDPGRAAGGAREPRRGTGLRTRAGKRPGPLCGCPGHGAGLSPLGTSGNPGSAGTGVRARSGAAPAVTARPVVPVGAPGRGARRCPRVGESASTRLVVPRVRPRPPPALRTGASPASPVGDPSRILLWAAPWCPQVPEEVSGHGQETRRYARPRAALGMSGRALPALGLPGVGGERCAAPGVGRVLG